jgi:hypothetical protein
MPEKILPVSGRLRARSFGGATRPPLVRMMRIHELLSAGGKISCSVLARG